MQHFPPYYQIKQRLVLTELHQNIDVVGILKEVLEPDNIIMPQTPMQLDLTHELLLGPGLGERSLFDDFGSKNPVGFLVRKFIAFGEPAFSEELASCVLFNRDVPVEADNLLLDHDGLGIGVGLAAGALVGGGFHPVGLKIIVNTS